jgi:hypothetical protein
METSTLIKQIQSVLTPDLLKPEWRIDWSPDNPLHGHCYAASEALYHLLGGKRAGWMATHGEGHWWLENRSTGERLDPTAGQYQDREPPYDMGRRAGFLTKKPSQRAQTIIDRVKALT